MTKVMPLLKRLWKFLWIFRINLSFKYLKYIRAECYLIMSFWTLDLLIFVASVLDQNQSKAQASFSALLITTFGLYVLNVWRNYIALYESKPQREFYHGIK